MQRRNWIIQENSATFTLSSAYEAFLEPMDWVNPHNLDERRLLVPMHPVGWIVAAHPNMTGRTELVISLHTDQTNHVTVRKKNHNGILMWSEIACKTSASNLWMRKFFVSPQPSQKKFIIMWMMVTDVTFRVSMCTSRMKAFQAKYLLVSWFMLLSLKFSNNHHGIYLIYLVNTILPFKNSSVDNIILPLPFLFTNCSSCAFLEFTTSVIVSRGHETSSFFSLKF